jgi:hypothetical protein
MLVAALALAGSPAAAQGASNCAFLLGFQTLYSLIPAEVGSCLDDEAHDPNTGDAVQHTTGGLLVWRRADNWTAFTNGYRTWINGPQGLAQRSNTVRFSWEANPDHLPLVAGAAISMPSNAAATLAGSVVTANKKTVTLASLDGHQFYMSASKRATTIYCDDDPGRKALSAKNAVGYPSFAAALTARPAGRLHRPC